MKNKHSYSGRARSIPAGIGIGIGTAVSALVSVIGAAILAWLVISQRIAEEGIGWGSMVILPVASAAGCFTSWGLIKHRRLMVCMIQCASFYAALLLLALPFGGQYDALAVTALLIVLGGAVTLIPGLVGSKSGAHRFRKMGFR